MRKRFVKKQYSFKFTLYSVDLKFCIHLHYQSNKGLVSVRRVIQKEKEEEHRKYLATQEFQFFHNPPRNSPASSKTKQSAGCFEKSQSIR